MESQLKNRNHDSSLKIEATPAEQDLLTSKTFAKISTPGRIGVSLQSLSL